jgi:hypothetical protein
MAAAISDATVRRALSLEPVQQQLARNLANGGPNLNEVQVRESWSQDRGLFSEGGIRFVIQLADHFGWDAEDTAVFLVLGSTPLIEPIRASIQIREFPDELGHDVPRSRARIILEFDPWLSKETVADIYEKLRKQLIGKGSKRPDVAQLEAFRFALQHLGDDGEPIESWAAIGRAWNLKHDKTDWVYHNPEDIRRAYRSVRDRLLNRAYEISGTRRLNPLPPGGAERGSHMRMYVDPRERRPMEPPARRAQQ